MPKYATLEWTYPAGERTPIGFQVIAESLSGSQLYQDQKAYSGPVYALVNTSCTFSNGTYNNLLLSGGYGAGAKVSFTVSAGVVTLTQLTGGDLYHIDDELAGTTGSGENTQYVRFKVSQVLNRIVYTTDYLGPFKMAIRSVFPDGKSAWVYSNTLTP